MNLKEAQAYQVQSQEIGLYFILFFHVKKNHQKLKSK